MSTDADSPPRRKSLLARESLLDAAERLFAAHGYHGVSIRDVAGEAGLSLGKLNYHFGTKENLFRQVVARRADEYVAAIDRSLNALLEASPQPSPEEVVRAHVGPIFDLAQNHGQGWKNYLQLLARAMNDKQNQGFLEPMWELYDPLLKRIISCFEKACPSAPKARLHWGFYFLESSLIHILLEAGNIDRHSDGLCLASDIDSIVAQISPFFGAAFASLK